MKENKYLPKIRAFFRALPVSLMGGIPGLDQRITQVRPINNNGENEFNTTLNAIWERLFGSNGGLGIVLIILTVFAGIILVNAGIRYVSAGSAPDRATKARAMIMHTVLAIVLIVASYTILRIIISLATFLASNR